MGPPPSSGKSEDVVQGEPVNCAGGRLGSVVGVGAGALTLVKSSYRAGGVNASRKRGIVMKAENVAIQVTDKEEDLLLKLVCDELDRRCQVIDELIQLVYDVTPLKHTEEAIAKVKTAILELVRSPLADLERKLACVEVEPEEKPAEVAEPGEVVKPAEEAEAVVAVEEALAGKKQPKK